MYTILVADDHPLFREAICSVILSRFPASTIIETENLEDTLTQANNQPDIDLLLLDLNMPGMQGLSGLLALRSQTPTIPVVIVSAENDKKTVLQAISFGAVGFISKSTDRGHIAEALEQILDGNVYLPPDIIRAMPLNNEGAGDGGSRQTLSAESLQQLTRRQLLVLERMVRGESNKQIAYNLNIAETTVKGHVSAILKKLGVHNRVQAVLSAGEIDFSSYLLR